MDKDYYITQLSDILSLKLVAVSILLSTLPSILYSTLTSLPSFFNLFSFTFTPSPPFFLFPPLFHSILYLLFQPLFNV